MGFWFPLFGAFLFCGSDDCASRIAAQQTDRPIEGSATEASVRVAEALRKALDSGWRDLNLEVECQTDSGWQAVEIFGNGIGIWNRKSQFELEREQLTTVLDDLQKSDFATMQEVYGGREDPGEPDQAAVLRVVCRISLELDGARKQVAQLHRGRQSLRFKQLAERIIAICRQPAEESISATDLEDGLRKINSGDLAPECFQLMVYQKVAPQKPGNQARGMLMRIRGRGVTTQAGGANGESLILELSPAELQNLASILLEQKIGDLPVNLYAVDYVDLVISVLNWKKNVQARQFAGMTSTTHGEKQDRFDQIFAELRKLHQKALAEGGAPVD